MLSNLTGESPLSRLAWKTYNDGDWVPFHTEMMSRYPRCLVVGKHFERLQRVGVQTTYGTFSQYTYVQFTV